MVVKNLGLASVGLLFIAARFAIILDVGKKLDFEADLAGERQLIGMDIEGMDAVEDLVTWKDGILLGGSGNVMKVLNESPEACEQGFIVAIDAKSGSPVVSRVEMVNTPGNPWRFHPHGMFYSSKSERLYVVNHGGVSGVGSRVEMFSVSSKKDGSPLLTWEMGIAGKRDDGKENFFGHQVLNSVIEGAKNEIYVTQFLPFPAPGDGLHHPQTLKDYARITSSYGLIGLSFMGFTGVHRCTFDSMSKKTIECTQVYSGMVMANGITISEDLSTVFVADTIRREIVSFSRDLKNGDLKLLKKIQVPHAVDNLHIDYESGELWVGTIPNVGEFLLHAKHIPGTFTVGEATAGGGLKFFDELVSDGKVLSGISACAKLKNGDKKWAVCGSPSSPGLLVAPLLA